MAGGKGVLMRQSIAAAVESRRAFLDHEETLPPRVVAATKVATAWVWFGQVLGLFVTVCVVPALGMSFFHDNLLWMMLFLAVGIWGAGALSWVGGNFLKAGLYQRALRSVRPSLDEVQGSPSSSTAVPLLRG